jgi:hypothetical protein
MQAARNHRLMNHSQFGSAFSCKRLTLLAVAVLLILVSPGRSPAQDAGVSGIPPGPANARGLNGSISDPSGIGNAAKVAPLPQPDLRPVPVPSVSSPVVARSAPLPATVKIRRTRFATSGSKRAAAAVSAQDKQLDHKVSICRGC